MLLKKKIFASMIKNNKKNYDKIAYGFIFNYDDNSRLCR